MNCTICNRPLNESVFNNDRTKKSCPSCSTKNGLQHVYYDFPQGFGTSSKRTTAMNPEGIQSYCTPCRGNNTPTNQGILCENINSSR